MVSVSDYYILFWKKLHFNDQKLYMYLKYYCFYCTFDKKMQSWWAEESSEAKKRINGTYLLNIGWGCVE